MTENDLADVKANSDVGDATTVHSNINDLDMKRDSEFLDKIQQILTNNDTSKLFVPYLSQFRVTYQKARRSIKKRIEPNRLNEVKFEELSEDSVSKKSTQEIDSHNIVEISTEGAAESVTPADSLSDETISINQYWEISNRKDSLHAFVVETGPFMVQFFEPNTSRKDTYRLNDVKFEVLPEDFVRKVKDPQLVAAGRSRVSYVF